MGKKKLTLDVVETAKTLEIGPVFRDNEEDNKKLIDQLLYILWIAFHECMDAIDANDIKFIVVNLGKSIRSILLEIYMLADSVKTEDAIKRAICLSAHANTLIGLIPGVQAGDVNFIPSEKVAKKNETIRWKIGKVIKAIFKKPVAPRSPANISKKCNTDSILNGYATVEGNSQSEVIVIVKKTRENPVYKLVYVGDTVSKEGVTLAHLKIVEDADQEDYQKKDESDNPDHGRDVPVNFTDDEDEFPIEKEKLEESIDEDYSETGEDAVEDEKIDDQVKDEDSQSLNSAVKSSENGSKSENAKTFKTDKNVAKEKENADSEDSRSKTSIDPEANGKKELPINSHGKKMQKASTKAISEKKTGMLPPTNKGKESEKTKATYVRSTPPILRNKITPKQDMNGKIVINLTEEGKVTEEAAGDYGGGAEEIAMPNFLMKKNGPIACTVYKCKFIANVAADSSLLRDHCRLTHSREEVILACHCGLRSMGPIEGVAHTVGHSRDASPNLLSTFDKAVAVDEIVGNH